MKKSAKMASKATNVDVCPVCLETRPLKIVGRCKHRFCVECLTVTLGSQKGDVFPCPTCKVECPRPWDGVKGMVDFTGEDVAVVDTVVKMGQRGGAKGHTGRGKTGAEAESQLKEGRGAEKRKKKKDGNVVSITMDVKCRICHHKKKEVQAVNLCVECGNLYICEECSTVHARNKATQGHVVVRLRSETKKQEAMCEEHDSALNSYCDDCGIAVCMVCVMLVHGEHTVEKLADVVDENVAELKEVLEEKEEELEKVKDLQSDLAMLKLIVPMVDKQDILIKEIEDHAQKCIEQITKWKEALKDQIKVDYKVIQDIPVGFEKVAAIVQELQEPIERAGSLLAETEYDLEYLDKLIALQQEIDAMVIVEGEIEGGYRKQLRRLHHKDHTFLPEEIPSSFGKLGCAEQLEVRCGGYDPYKLEKISQNTMQVTSDDMFIPRVVNIGKVYAVAHPTRLGEPAAAIDIYEFPGTLKHTLTDHIPPLYDMSSTPDGKLAALSDGTGGTSCSIKLFDPDTGYISCTRDIDIDKPLSLGVTLQHQYVILGGNKEGQSIITIVDRDGVVESTLAIDEDFNQEDLVSDVDSDENVDDTEGVSDEADDADDDFNIDIDTCSNVAADIPKRIACGGRFIFVLGNEIVGVYESTDTEIRNIKKIDNVLGSVCTDISATIWDDYVVSFFYLKNGWLQKGVKDNVNKCEWDYYDEHVILHLESEDARPARISAGDGHVVAGQGQTIRVFKIIERDIE